MTFFEWKKAGISSKGDSIEELIGNITFDLSSIPPIDILDKGNDFLLIKMGNDTCLFDNIEKKGNEISFYVTTQTDKKIYFVSHEDNMPSYDFHNFANIGDVISIVEINGENNWYNHNTQEFLPVWPIIWGGACLILSIIDYYCDKQIEEGAQNCTNNGQGTIVHSCGVECVEICE